MPTLLDERRGVSKCAEVGDEKKGRHTDGGTARKGATRRSTALSCELPISPIVMGEPVRDPSSATFSGSQKSVAGPRSSVIVDSLSGVEESV